MAHPLGDLVAIRVDADDQIGIRFARPFDGRGDPADLLIDAYLGARACRHATDVYDVSAVDHRLADGRARGLLIEGDPVVVERIGRSIDDGHDQRPVPDQSATAKHQVNRCRAHRCHAPPLPLARHRHSRGRVHLQQSSQNALEPAQRSGHPSDIKRRLPPTRDPFASTNATADDYRANNHPDTRARHAWRLRRRWGAAPLCSRTWHGSTRTRSEPPALHLLIRLAPTLVGDFGVATDRPQAAVAERLGGEPSVAHRLLQQRPSASVP